MERSRGESADRCTASMPRRLKSVIAVDLSASIPNLCITIRKEMLQIRPLNTGCACQRQRWTLSVQKNPLGPPRLCSSFWMKSGKAIRNWKERREYCWRKLIEWVATSMGRFAKQRVQHAFLKKKDKSKS